MNEMNSKRKISSSDQVDTSSVEKLKIASKEELRKKLLKFTMYERNDESKREGEKFYTYLETADTRNKKVRQNIINRMKKLSESDDCEYCSSMFKDSGKIQSKWEKNSNIFEGKKSIKDSLKQSLRKFVSTESSPAKHRGEKIIREIDKLDIRRDDVKKEIFKELDTLTNIKDCETCSSLNPIKEETKKHFWRKK